MIFSSLDSNASSRIENSKEVDGRQYVCKNETNAPNAVDKFNRCAKKCAEGQHDKGKIDSEKQESRFANRLTDFRGQPKCFCASPFGRQQVIAIKAIKMLDANDRIPVPKPACQSSEVSNCGYVIAT
jgi:hypothetical protein